MNNIVLIGMSGVGKTKVGQYISKKLEMTLFDTDNIIETKYGITISDIFSNFGEQYFRSLENKIIEDVSKYNNSVISTGGGVVLNSINIYNLKKNGIIFWLKADLNTIYNNLKKDSSSANTRPLLGNGLNLKERIEQLYGEREKLYASNSDYVVQVDGRTIEDVGDEIIFIFKSLNSCS